VDRARKIAPDVEVTGRWAVSGISYELVDASKDATLVVVSRGHGELASAAIGSVAFSVSSHAHCPVVVVRGDDIRPPDADRPVVVGSDGSECSAAAVRFAADTAAATGAQLVVASAYRGSVAQAWTTVGGWIPDVGGSEAFDRAVRHAAEDITSKAAIHLAHCPVAVIR
jgi:nucleotide-binding universal stress UspA family protein